MFLFAVRKFRGGNHIYVEFLHNLFPDPVSGPAADRNHVSVWVAARSTMSRYLLPLRKICAVNPAITGNVCRNYRPFPCRGSGPGLPRVSVSRTRARTGSRFWFQRTAGRPQVHLMMEERQDETRNGLNSFMKSIKVLIQRVAPEHHAGSAGFWWSRLWICSWPAD